MNKRQLFTASAACVALAAGAVSMLSAASASAAGGLEPKPRGTISGTYGSPAALTCTGPGNAAGDINGDGKADEITVDALHYNVTGPRDAGSGMATGKRQHRPTIIIRKEMSPSSSAWSRLYASGSVLTCSLTHKGVGTYSDGTSRPLTTARMTGVTVTDHQVMLGDTRSPEEGGLAMHEEIELTTELVTWSSTMPT